MPDLDGSSHFLPPRIQPFTDGETGSDDGHAAPLVREGLPKTFRSRHDRHYVEQLTANDAQPVRLVAVSRIDAADLLSDQNVAALAASISELGIVQPLLVRPHNGRFRLIAGRRRLAAARRAGLTEVPCLIHAVSDSRALELAAADNLRVHEMTRPAFPASAAEAREMDAFTELMLQDLQDAVAGLQACLPLLAGKAGVREKVALKLLTIESERAAWAIHARRYLAGVVPVARTEVSGPSLLQRVQQQVESALALRGGTLCVEVARPEIMVQGDSKLLATSLVGLIHAVLAIGDLVQEPRAVVRLADAPEAGLVLAVSQPSVLLAEADLARFFAAGWAGRPGGASAELAVLLASHTARVHAASLDVYSAPGAGTVVSMTFPG